MKNSFIAKLDAAISGETPPPKPDPIARIRAALAAGIISDLEAPGHPSALRARHGVPEPMRAAIGRTARKNVPDYASRKKQVLEIAARSRLLFDELGRIAAKTEGRLSAEHLDDLSSKILAGKTSVDALDGWSPSELESDKQAKLSAYKNLLRKNSVEIHLLAQPVFKAATAASNSMLETEILAEGEKLATFGLPFEKPTEAMLSLMSARAVLERRAGRVPFCYEGLSDLTLNLFEE